MPTSRPPDAQTSLRSDAARNRQRIVEAARQLIADEGLDVGYDEIARAAGVGVGTVYRRFPTRDALYSELFEDRLQRLIQIAEEASQIDDPWTGLRTLIERDFELQAQHRGLREFLLSTEADESDIARRARAAVVPAYATLVQRAQTAGQIRGDISHTDIGVLLAMLGSLLDAAHEVDADLWRRYALLILTGIQPTDQLHNLAGIAPTQSRLQQVLGRWARPRRNRL